MDFRIQDVPKSSVSEFSFGAMACCITSYNISLAVHHGLLTKGAFVIISIAGIIFVGWLIWFFRMYLGDRTVIAMPRSSGRVVEIVNWILFAIWVLTTWVTGACSPICGIASWCLWCASFLYYIFSTGSRTTADKEM